MASAKLLDGSLPIESGAEPYSVNWTVQNTGSPQILIDAASNIVQPSYTFVICSSVTQWDPAGTPKCPPESYDLGTASHGANPGDPVLNAIGVLSYAMGPCETVFSAGTTPSSPMYVLGANNDAHVVLDGATEAPVKLRVNRAFNKGA